MPSLVGLTGNSKPNWVADADAKGCRLCRKPFSLTRRRHHCRACGGVFCHGCSAGSRYVETYRSVQRVCATCEGDSVSPPPSPATSVSRHASDSLTKGVPRQDVALMHAVLRVSRRFLTEFPSHSFAELTRSALVGHAQTAVTFTSSDAWGETMGLLGDVRSILADAPSSTLHALRVPLARLAFSASDPSAGVWKSGVAGSLVHGIYHDIRFVDVTTAKPCIGLFVGTMAMHQREGVTAKDSLVSACLVRVRVNSPGGGAGSNGCQHEAPAHDVSMTRESDGDAKVDYVMARHGRVDTDVKAEQLVRLITLALEQRATAPAPGTPVRVRICSLLNALSIVPRELKYFRKQLAIMSGSNVANGSLSSYRAGTTSNMTTDVSPMSHNIDSSMFNFRTPASLELPISPRDRKTGQSQSLDPRLYNANTPASLDLPPSPAHLKSAGQAEDRAKPLRAAGVSADGSFNSGKRTPPTGGTIPLQLLEAGGNAKPGDRQNTWPASDVASSAGGDESTAPPASGGRPPAFSCTPDFAAFSNHTVFTPPRPRPSSRSSTEACSPGGGGVPRDIPVGNREGEPVNASPSAVSLKAMDLLAKAQLHAASESVEAGDASFSDASSLLLTPPAEKRTFLDAPPSPPPAALSTASEGTAIHEDYWWSDRRETGRSRAKAVGPADDDSDVMSPSLDAPSVGSPAFQLSRKKSATAAPVAPAFDFPVAMQLLRADYSYLNLIANWPLAVRLGTAQDHAKHNIAHHLGYLKHLEWLIADTQRLLRDVGRPDGDFLSKSHAGEDPWKTTLPRIRRTIAALSAAFAAARTDEASARKLPPAEKPERIPGTPEDEARDADGSSSGDRPAKPVAPTADIRKRASELYMAAVLLGELTAQKGSNFRRRAAEFLQLTLLEHLLDVVPVYNCKSGIDRTGVCSALWTSFHQILHRKTNAPPLWLWFYLSLNYPLLLKTVKGIHGCGDVSSGRRHIPLRQLEESCLKNMSCLLPFPAAGSTDAAALQLYTNVEELHQLLNPQQTQAAHASLGSVENRAYRLLCTLFFEGDTSLVAQLHHAFFVNVVASAAKVAVASTGVQGLKYGESGKLHNALCAQFLPTIACVDSPTAHSTLQLTEVRRGLAGTEIVLSKEFSQYLVAAAEARG
eukprot:gene3432-5374_t